MLSIVMLTPLEDMLQYPGRKARSKQVLVGEPSRKDLEEICQVLNSKKAKGTFELQRLVKAWFASGPNLKKMLHADHRLWGDVQNSWRSLYVPTNTGRAHIALFPEGPGENKESPQDEARRLFAALTLNPQNTLLAGPCARCGNYYLKKTRRQKVYCSQRCGTTATALSAVSKKRADEHAQGLRSARAALLAWKPTSNEEGWKKAISRRTNLTVQWLSRAANKGELSPPRIPVE
jgi:hypothetical protein